MVFVTKQAHTLGLLDLEYSGFLSLEVGLLLLLGSIELTIALAELSQGCHLQAASIVLLLFGNESG